MHRKTFPSLPAKRVSYRVEFLYLVIKLHLNRRGRVALRSWVRVSLQTSGRSSGMTAAEPPAVPQEAARLSSVIRPAAFYSACSLSNRNLFTERWKVIECHATWRALDEWSSRLWPTAGSLYSAAETVWGLWFLLQEPRDPCAVLTLALTITALACFTYTTFAALSCFHDQVQDC